MASIPRQAYTYTAPVPFVKPDEELPYYDQYFTEAMVHINSEETELGIANTTWYRYFMNAGVMDRESFTPHNPVQDADLFNPHGDSTQFNAFWNNYIMDMREAFTKANGLLDTWGITLQEWLEDYKGFGYAAWLHAEANIGENGDLYDRDLDEVRMWPRYYFVVEAPAGFEVGVAFEVTITAYKNGEVFTAYAGTCNLSLALTVYNNLDPGDPDYIAPGDTSYDDPTLYSIDPVSVTGFVNGVKTFDLTITCAV